MKAHFALWVLYVVLFVYCRPHVVLWVLYILQFVYCRPNFVLLVLYLMILVYFVYFVYCMPRVVVWVLYVVVFVYFVYCRPHVVLWVLYVVLFVFLVYLIPCTWISYIWDQAQQTIQASHNTQQWFYWRSSPLSQYLENAYLNLIWNHVIWKKRRFTEMSTKGWGLPPFRNLSEFCVTFLFGVWGGGCSRQTDYGNFRNSIFL